MVVQLVIAVIAMIAMSVFLLRAAPPLARYASPEFKDEVSVRRRAAQQLILYPLLIGIVVTSLLQLPIPHPISILATTCAPMSLMLVFGALIGLKEGTVDIPKQQILANKVSPFLVGLFVVGVILNRLLVVGW